jgi:hypothetical protein
MRFSQIGQGQRYDAEARCPELIKTMAREL